MQGEVCVDAYVFNLSRFKLIRSEETDLRNKKRRTRVTLYNADNIYGNTLLFLQPSFSVSMMVKKTGCRDIVIGGDNLVVTLDCLTGNTFRVLDIMNITRYLQ